MYLRKPAWFANIHYKLFAEDIVLFAEDVYMNNFR